MSSSSSSIREGRFVMAIGSPGGSRIIGYTTKAIIAALDWNLPMQDAVALPNLASWHNRLALLLGYQPRDVEFCSVQVVGHAPMYREALPVGHIHTPTTRAFREFMSLMGFDEVRTHALRPMNSPVGRPLRVLDAVVGRFPSSSRRFLYLGRRAREPIAPSNDGWWSG